MPDSIYREPDGTALKHLRKKPHAWVMVLDRHRARIFSKKDGNIFPVAEMAPTTEADLALTNQNIGRTISASGNHIHHKLEPHMQAAHKQEVLFAHKVGAFLNAEALKGSFDKLALVAAPSMLGELRKTIGKSLRSRVVAEISKDLTKMDEKSLKEELEKILWF